MDHTKYGLMVYQTGHRLYNAGDYIQSLAAAQYLPRVDAHINREALAAYQGDLVKMIMNGWYMHRPEQWPPSGRINPLFVSFHINSAVRDRMLTPEGIAYLKQHTPIGCRDLYTLSLLQEKGIEAYHSGCLTTTLDLKYKADESERTDKIYIVDPFFNLFPWKTLAHDPKEMAKSLLRRDTFRIGLKKKLLDRIFTQSLLRKSIPLTHNHKFVSEVDRFGGAKDLLDKYARARLVITSRIHVALPCLALNTPVLFLNYGLSAVATERCRVEGIMDLFNTISVDRSGRTSANFDCPERIDEHFLPANPVHHVSMAQSLKDRCSTFVQL